MSENKQQPPSFEAPQPGADFSLPRPEVKAAAPEATPAPSAPVVAAAPANDPVASAIHDATSPQGGPQQAQIPSSDNPQIADDIDVIEKEWVQKAKKIVEETKEDPHLQKDRLSEFKADYMKKRYNKDIKIEE